MSNKSGYISLVKSIIQRTQRDYIYAKDFLSHKENKKLKPKEWFEASSWNNEIELLFDSNLYQLYCDVLNYDPKKLEKAIRNGETLFMVEIE